jgi:uncharacterized membrane protein
MKKVLAVSALALGLSMGSMAYADTKESGDQCEYKKSGARQSLLEQLPPEKETLFHRTMRDAREKKAAIHEDLVKAREDARRVLLAPEFNEALYKEKTARVAELIEREHQVMQDAIASLARQFTPDERKVLAEVVAKSKPHRRWSSHRQML